MMCGWCLEEGGLGRREEGKKRKGERVKEKTPKDKKNQLLQALLVLAVRGLVFRKVG